MKNSVSQFMLSLKNKYCNDDIDWVKYVQDHYNEILKSSSVHIIDVNDFYWKFHRLEDFLTDLQYDKNLAWIVLMINQIDSNVEFKDIKSILLPNVGYINSLHQTFLQYRSHIKSSR